MLSNKTLSRWGFILASILIISLILWNTYIFFIQLKENERKKMEIWAVAQGELAQSIAGEGSSGNRTYHHPKQQYDPYDSSYFKRGLL